MTDDEKKSMLIRLSVYQRRIEDEWHKLNGQWESIVFSDGLYMAWVDLGQAITRIREAAYAIEDTMEG